MSSYLNTINPASECEGFPPSEELATVFPFPLDPFQKHAVKAIHEGDNVLVTAKTGSGKTLVGEYLIHHIIKKGGRVFYTTPIKSLSNQKFHDLKNMFPSVGIMTGDIKYRPDAQILIMTTEILRNLLYKQNTATASLGLTAAISLEGLQGVVFDEVHYINDRERGKVWEETMILLPREVQMVLLSATIDRPDLFASWLGDLKQKMVHLISTTYRIVPLIHQVLMGSEPQLLMDNKESFYENTYRKWLEWRNSKAKDARGKEQAVAGRRRGGYEDAVVKGPGGMASFAHQMNDTIRMFQHKNLMPAIFFVLSRVGCEKYAQLVEGSLIESSEAAAIQHIWDFHLHRHKDVLEHLPQAHTILQLVKRGIAFHHSGLLPMLREMVEILFGKGLIKALFATETFAVGLNMPTKTVVFVDLMKYSDETHSMRILRTDEYVQMAGRAGRRGKDDIGHVFYLPQREPVDCHEMKCMMTGNKSAITSRMDFGYDFLLKTVHSGNLRWMDIVEKSYWFRQRLADKTRYTEEVKVLDKKTADLGLTDKLLELCAQRFQLERDVKVKVNAAKKEAQKLLDSCKNKFVGPAMDKAWKSYALLDTFEKEKAEIQGELARLESIKDTTLQPRIDLLEKWGFMTMTDGVPTLTKLGTLATELNEGQPILMVRAYTEGICADFTQDDFVPFFAAFMNEGKDEDSPSLASLNISKTVKDSLWKINEWAAVYDKEEMATTGDQGNGKFWALKTDWIEPLSRWAQGENAAILCQEYGIFEGNLMRSALKIANVVEEWTCMATFCQDIELLTKLEGLREKMVRDIAKPDSLYLCL
jgi:superfamily II RNA helicase